MPLATYDTLMTIIVTVIHSDIEYNTKSESQHVPQ